MPTKVKKRKLSPKKIQKGTVGNFFVFGMLAFLAVLGIVAVGGLPPDTFSNTGQIVNIVTPTQSPTHSTLQLQTFGYVTLAPTPTPNASEGLCKRGGANDEPEIIAGYFPGPGQTVGATGQIKVWVQDEGAPFIAPGQQINTSTGAVVAGTGNLSAKAPDNYLWEPALYIAPHTAETGGSPYFPSKILGTVNNDPPTISGNIIQGPTPESIPAGQPTAAVQPGMGFGGGFYSGGYGYEAEYLWDVSSLKLPSGSYQAEFLIFDGDRNRGVGCVNIQIQ